jgi:hypothetical protein
MVSSKDNNKTDEKGRKQGVFYLFLSIGCLLLLFLFIWLHHKSDGKADSIISIIGTVASLCGIVEALWQIHSLKSRTKAVQDALNNARDEMSNLTIFAELNKHSQFVNEIQNYVRMEQFSEALITYKDLKEKLTVLSGYIRVKVGYEDECEALRILVDTAGGDLKTLNSVVINSVVTLYSVDKEDVVNNLEKIKTFLDNTAGKLKGKKI